MTVPTDRRPIGFWLKLVDRLIDERFERTLGSLTRRHWQVLNVVQQGLVDQAALDSRVRPFIGVDGTTVREVADLRERGWIADADGLVLTELGAREFQRLLDVVSADRSALMHGIAPEAYASTVATLEAMARNLGWDPHEPR